MRRILEITMAKQDLGSYYGPTSRPRTSLPLLPRQRSDGGERIHAIFSVIGLLAGIGAGVIAYLATTSIALPIFAFFMTNMFVGRGLGDVVTDRHKGRRTIYFALLPAACTGVLYLTYQWWGRMWLAAIVGLLVGIVVWNLLVTVLFPEIHVDELKDNERRRSRAAAGTSMRSMLP